jgi:hypothetical protein
MKRHNRIGCAIAEAAKKGHKRNLQISEDKGTEHLCHPHDTATQKAMRPDTVWESSDKDGNLGWQLVEVACPWARIDHGGETLEKAYKKNVEKYDQLLREITEAYPGKPVTQTTIVISATSAFMKKSMAEFSRVTRLEGKHLAQWSRNVVDAAIRGSYDIYTDSMQRVKYNREHAPDPAVRIARRVGEDGEAEELFGANRVEDL